MQRKDCFALGNLVVRSYGSWRRAIVSFAVRYEMWKDTEARRATHVCIARNSSFTIYKRRFKDFSRNPLRLVW
jgi:hypothetical protein